MVLSEKKSKLNRKWRIPAILLLVCILTAACGEAPPSYDGPPEAETPPPLDGVYEGEYGKLVFNGDEKTLIAEFTKDAAEYLPNGELEIVFRWYSFGICAYNVATECSLYQGETEYVFDCLGTNTDAICLTFLYAVSDGNVTSPDTEKIQMIFERKE